LKNDELAVGINAPDVGNNVFDVMISDVRHNVVQIFMRAVGYNASKKIVGCNVRSATEGCASLNALRFENLSTNSEISNNKEKQSV
jgi:hypothetical protein